MIYSVFDTLLDAVVVLDAGGRLLYGNQVASQLFDVSQKRLSSNKPLVDLVQFADPSCFAHEQLAQVASPTPYVEMSFVCKSGKEGWVQISLQADEQMGQKCFIVFIRDVTLEETLQRKYRAELEQKEGVIIDLQKAQAELENYSKNLEKMVEERTRELSEANRLLKAILDSLGQGFFVFDETGRCLPIYSRICQSILEGIPAGEKIQDVLRIPEAEKTDFQTWCTTLFEEPIPFSDLVPLGPRLFPHSQNWHVELEFHPMRNDEDKVVGVVVVASNKTDEYKARLEAERERHLVRMILKIIRGKRQFVTFLNEARKMITELEEQVSRPTLDVNALSYHLHTLKGGAGSFSMQALHDFAHRAEDVLKQWQSADAKVSSQQELVALVGHMHRELEEFLSQYGVIVGSLQTQRRAEIPVADIMKFAARLPELEGERLRDYAREPIGGAFDHYRELVQDIAQAQSKEMAPLQMEGGDLRIFPEYYQETFASLIHVFRNAVDHGLEAPDVRESQGKPRFGTLTVHCGLSSDRKQLLITVQEDGKGIDPQIVRRKLLEKGIIIDSESDQQVIQHVFDDAFSTREEITQLSGRGVGLAAVKQAVLKLGGSIRVESVVGRGSRFELALPYFALPMPELSEMKAAA